MKTTLIGIALAAAITTSAASYAAAAPEPAAAKLELKGGGVLYLHPDGTGRMVDVHGKAMMMKDGKEMALTDGRMVMMMNKKVWVMYGPPGKGSTVLKTE